MNYLSLGTQFETTTLTWKIYQKENVWFTVPNSPVGEIH